MEKIFGWSVLAVVLWTIISAILFITPHLLPELKDISIAFFQYWTDMISSIAEFFAPIIQFAIILFILIEASRRVGLGRMFKQEEENTFDKDGDLQKPHIYSLLSDRTQAVLALIIVSSLCISAIAGLKSVTILKDLALVVVGFYFGSRVKKDEDIVWFGPRRTSSTRNMTDDSS